MSDQAVLIVIKDPAAVDYETKQTVIVQVRVRTSAVEKSSMTHHLFIVLKDFFLEITRWLGINDQTLSIY